MDGGQRIFPIGFRELAYACKSPPIFHHSLIAELGSSIVRFREFVLFHGEYVYPEYLLAYHRCYKGAIAGSNQSGGGGKKKKKKKKKTTKKTTNKGSKTLLPTPYSVFAAAQQAAASRAAQQAKTQAMQTIAQAQAVAAATAQAARASALAAAAARAQQLQQHQMEALIVCDCGDQKKLRTSQSAKNPNRYVSRRQHCVLACVRARACACACACACVCVCVRACVRIVCRSFLSIRINLTDNIKIRAPIFFFYNSRRVAHKHNTQHTTPHNCKNQKKTGGS